jgi:hypothetical protein
MSSRILTKLTEGIVERSVQREGSALLEKWEKTGLLEGLRSDNEKASMARLLENQAKELLREATTMAAGDVEGFASVAFPIVRRVFAGLIANDLVSVQPMSLPSGLIFFLDFTYTHGKTHAGAVAGESLYGGGKVAKGISEGVSLTDTSAEKGFYNLNNGYASPSGTFNVTGAAALGADDTLVSRSWGSAVDYNAKLGNAITSSFDQSLVQYDPDILADSAAYYKLYAIELSAAHWGELNLDDIIAIDFGTTHMSGATVVRRLSTVRSRTAYQLNMVLRNTVDTWPDLDAATTHALQFAHKDQFTAGGALGSVAGTHEWYLEALSGTDQDIPEIDLKVDSISVTAVTKKLKASWTPELGQDLDAYHNLDAEVELTGILSEQIALEIDREIIVDLIKGATAGTYYWSRQPGKFLERTTGTPIDRSPTSLSTYPDFTGNVSEWYETLIETINDVSAQIHRKVLRGGANFLVCGPEVGNILEFTSGFRANVTHDKEKGNVGVTNTGSLSKKWDVWVDPYFPRNLILVGRKGAGFLESGYVYAPYVPLQVTPTIFGPDDFTPRKGVMTRYGKKMVRPDMYGLVIVEDLLGGVSYA